MRRSEKGRRGRSRLLDYKRRKRKNIEKENSIKWVGSIHLGERGKGGGSRGDITIGPLTGRPPLQKKGTIVSYFSIFKNKGRPIRKNLPRGLNLFSGGGGRP